MEWELKEMKEMAVRLLDGWAVMVGILFFFGIWDFFAVVLK